MGVKPVNEVRGLCVDTRVARFSTAISPRDNTRELRTAHKGTTRVTLARVFASLLQTSADHGIGNLTLSISFSAFFVTDNRNSNLKVSPIFLLVFPSNFMSPSLGLLPGLLNPHYNEPVYTEFRI